jgi:hypothetical protein
MADNVVILPVITRLDVPAQRVLDEAAKAGLTEIVILGYDGDGEEYFASNMADGGDIIWHLERAKLKLLQR